MRRICPINRELREGKQHCQKHTPEFLRETIRLYREITDEPFLVRLDSWNDSVENIGILIEAGCYLIIKRNLRILPFANLIVDWHIKTINFTDSGVMFTPYLRRSENGIIII